MPHCWKCGTQLDENAKFCSTCGAPVAPPAIEPVKRMGKEERKPIRILAILLIALLVITAVIAAFAFLPVRAIDFSESRDVPYQTGVDIINLDFTADIASVNVAFENLVGKLVTLNVSATGRAGLLVSPDLFNLTFDHTVVNNVLTVTSEVDVFSSGWPWHPWLRVTCDIRIDPSMNATLDVETSVGEIVINTQAGVVLNSLRAEAITGKVEVNLVRDVVVAGDVSIKTTTGGVEFSWDNVIVTNDVLVNVGTPTGGVDVAVKQYERLLRNVTLRAEATTGGIDLAIEIKGDVGAKIASQVTTGGINIVKQIGFSGTKSLLQSDNYPAGSNFDISLKTITGGIDIDAKHTP